MKSVIILGLFLTLGFFYEAKAQNAQSGPTKIVRFEVDGKEIKRKYTVFFRSNEKWIEAEKTIVGFNIPIELKDSEYFTVLIKTGKYKLYFPKIHNSQFSAEWVVGIDNKPFSDEISLLKKSKTVRRVYYIKFTGSALETVLFVIMDNSTK
jgi:hypothetical protein